MSRRILLAWLLVLLIVPVVGAPARAAQGGTPVCSLSVDPQPGYIDMAITGADQGNSPWFWYVAVLKGPLGEQQAYFRPQPSVTEVFASQGPGTYTGAVWSTVDNQKGPAKFTYLSSCGPLQVI